MLRYLKINRSSATKTRPTDTTVLIDMWLYGKSDLTARYYKRVINSFIAYLNDSGTDIISCKVEDLQGYLLSLEESRKSANTQNTYGNCIKSFLSYINKLGATNYNVGILVKPPKPQSALTERILNRSDIDDMISLESNNRNKLILELLFFCGLRVSELTSLKWRNVRDNGSVAYITVTGKGKKQRTLIIPPVLWTSLKDTKTANHDPIFMSRKGKGHLSTNQIWEIVRAASLRIGITASPHWLRHTHATLALQSGADVKQVSTSLGHSSVATTSKYLHARPNDCSSLYL